MRPRNTFLSVLLALSVLLSACGSSVSPEIVPEEPVEEEQIVSESNLPLEPAAVTTVQVEDFVSKIENKDDFRWILENEAAKELLTQNKFVVVPAYGEEFYSIYENNRYNYYPSFITTDSLLHNYHLAFDFLLRNLEEKQLFDVLGQLLDGMYGKASSQFTELQGTNWETAAQRNLAYVVLAGSLLEREYELDADLQQVVDAELALIEAKGGISDSALMNFDQANESLADSNLEDYTQYVPRGHYTRSEKLQKFFKSMMYMGRITFRLKDDDETRSALLLTLILDDPELAKLWDKIYEPTNFFVGQSDDLTYLDYKKAVTQVFGELSLQALRDNESKLDDLKTKLKELAAPKINSMPIFDQSITPDREDAIQGFRVMGQRYTLDADVFQNLVYRSLKEAEDGSRRMLPAVMDMAAAFGSELAYKIQTEDPENIKYPNYIENLDKMKSYIADLDEKEWTQNLYWGWLATIKTLFQTYDEKYPEFMQSLAWHYKSLMTAFGSFTELKHDTILYAKQAYAEMGGGPMEIEKKDDRGYVEPNTETFAVLAELTKLTKDGLKERDLLDEGSTEMLDRLYTLAFNLKNISEKELAGTELSVEDYEFIRSYGGNLEHIWIEANRDLQNTAGMDDEMAAVVADIATSPDPLEFLEQGTGYVYTIVVLIPETNRLASGGVFSHYEFKSSERLTDEIWREKLRSQEAPEIASWAAKFIAPRN